MHHDANFGATKNTSIPIAFSGVLDSYRRFSVAMYPNNLVFLRDTV
jgi:hypothetical protein